MGAAELVTLLLVLSLAAVVVSLAMHLVARFGGWRALARHYTATRPFLGRRLHFQFAQLGGWANYNGALTTGADATGLLLSVWPILRIGHPCLFVPWSEIQATKERRWLGEVVLLRFSAEPGTVLTISKRLADRLASESGHPLP